MTDVTLRYFASVREALGRREEKVEVKAKTVQGVLEWLAKTYGPQLTPQVFDSAGRLREEYRVLLNGALCPREKLAAKKVADGDEIVIMPPVAGG
jgi:MoaD family protein